MMKIEENTFGQVYVDLTSRCNLNCEWCCNSKYKIPDISNKHFEKICSSLPKKIEIRLLGGEPTIHPNLFELIDIAKRYKHMVTVITNGIAFANLQYCKEIKEHGPLVISVSMDAEVDPSVQLLVLSNLQEAGFKRIVITSTITRDNIEMILYFKKLKQIFQSIKYMHFRNMINDPNALTYEELKQEVLKEFPEWNTPSKIIRDGKSYLGQPCCGRCELRWVTPDLQIMILDCSRAGKCHVRGYVDNESMTINHFFKEIKRRNTL
jgi:MoaA/NifB/PqqE/SkfB family radical SAM enzyme